MISTYSGITGNSNVVMLELSCILLVLPFNALSAALCFFQFHLYLFNKPSALPLANALGIWDEICVAIGRRYPKSDVS